MSTNAIIGGLVAAAVLGGGYVLITQSSQSEKMMNPSEGGEVPGQTESEKMMAPSSDAVMNPPSGGEGVVMESKGSYEAYAPEKLARAESGDVVLFFRASWCPTCKALDASIRSALPTIPEGLTILDVDYDNSQSLKQKYGVTYQHTLVQVRADGTMIKKWTGSPTLAALVAEVQ